METNKNPCFSNGTEWMIWRGNNCDRCWKVSKELDNGEFADYRCAVNEQMDMQIGLDSNVSERTYNIAQMTDCPHRQLTRPKYKSKPKNVENGLLFQ